MQVDTRELQESKAVRFDVILEYLSSERGEGLPNPWLCP